MKKITKLLFLPGLVIPIWLFVGVSFIASKLPGYDHVRDLMSRLGEKGSITEAISPYVNNYPIGALFVLFGVGLIYGFRSAGAKLGGVLFVSHGLLSIIAGVFPCDTGCPFTGSYSQYVHTAAAFLMFLTCLLAILFIGNTFKTENGSAIMATFSYVIIMVSVFALALALYSSLYGGLAGLFQRVSYGAVVIWVFVVSAKTMRIPITH